MWDDIAILTRYLLMLSFNDCLDGKTSRYYMTFERFTMPFEWNYSAIQIQRPRALYVYIRNKSCITGNLLKHLLDKHEHDEPPIKQRKLVAVGKKIARLMNLGTTDKA